MDENPIKPTFPVPEYFSVSDRLVLMVGYDKKSISDLIDHLLIVTGYGMPIRINELGEIVLRNSDRPHIPFAREMYDKSGADPSKDKQFGEADVRILKDYSILVFIFQGEAKDKLESLIKRKDAKSFRFKLNKRGEITLGILRLGSHTKGTTRRSAGGFSTAKAGKGGLK